MDKLVTGIPGGMPFTLDDLEFESRAIRKAIDDLVRAHFPSHVAIILWGCEVSTTPSGYTISEGAIYFEHEIYQVEQHFLNVALPVPEEPLWVFTKQPGPLGTKTFFNGEVHNIHEIRRCKMSMVPLDGQIASVPVSLVVRASNINRYQTRLHPISANGVNDLPQRPKPSYAHKSHDLIHISLGYSFYLFNTEPLHLTTLPSPYHTQYMCEYLINGYQPMAYTSPNVPLIVKILPDGKITAQRQLPQQGLFEVHINAQLLSLASS